MLPFDTRAKKHGLIQKWSEADLGTRNTSRSGITEKIYEVFAVMPAYNA
jgi:hypothetical protein